MPIFCLPVLCSLFPLEYFCYYGNMVAGIYFLIMKLYLLALKFLESGVMLAIKENLNVKKTTSVKLELMTVEILYNNPVTITL